MSVNSMFQQATGQPIRSYLTMRRLQRAWWWCRHTSEPMHLIARRVGYADPLYFSRAFRRFHGLSPTQARAAVHTSPRG